MTGSGRPPFFKSDLFAGALYALAFGVVLLAFGERWFYPLEAGLYDRIMTSRSVSPHPDITIVAIDEASVRNIGRFPFSRDVTAAVIDTLATGGAHTIASTLVFSEAQVDAGSDFLRDLRGTATDIAATLGNPEDQGKLDALQRQIDGAIAAIDYDQTLTSSVASAGNVLLPVLFDAVGYPAGRPTTPLPVFAAEHALANGTTLPAVPFLQPTLPLSALGKVAADIGHLGLIADVDGVVRDVPLIANYYGTAFSSLALTTALHTLNLDSEDLTLRDDGALVAAGLVLPADNEGRLRTQFYRSRDGQELFRQESFYDVFSGITPAASFRGKTVLIGPTAAGIGDALNTPAGTNTAPVTLLANAVSAILQQHIITRPSFTRWLEWLLYGLLFAYIALALPRLKATLAAGITLALIVGLLVVQWLALNGASLWLQCLTPVWFLIGGHLVMTSKRFGVTERLKVQTDAASAESNRMLGLAFQNQGQLDMAFEKFRRCPLDDSMMEPLYNLALDFERKRQFNKAGAVYSRMASHDPDYRDLAGRLKRSEQLDETLIIGHGGDAGATLMLDGDNIQKPMLGRYTVEKELGKGAMGTVYMGRDPKINRIVAIKTIAISQEFDENEVASVRDRFFREAETAGRLNHPDIVTVFDAGEEHDLAYIAMEYLRGDHLSGRTRSPDLLPDETTIELMARVAQALDYAHREDVVHRDIKPANIMYDPDSGDVKVTDFGIARITSSSKTKTGIVLGTPSYMSPEQLSGKNVTGRSDLFSLGVTLYQLLAGQLPFRADSMATLMYKIANEPHTPLRVARPDLPGCLEAVIDKALAKDADERYQTGAEMALDLRDCRATLAA
ncbi:MAG: CHASE2 domain-containing protein [Gammaproteobacteria bacterium]